MTNNIHTTNTTMKLPKTPTNLNCKDVLQCVFNLNTLDLTILQHLQTHGELRADKLAHYLNKERSTVYRSLQKLTKCSLCTKHTKTIPKGGYYHTYSCNDTQKIKHELETCLNHWYETMKQKLEHFGTETI